MVLFSFSLHKIQNVALIKLVGECERHKSFANILGLHIFFFISLLGAVSIRKTVLPGMAIPMLKIRTG